MTGRASIVIAYGVLAATLLPAAAARSQAADPQQPTVTVTGCIERDAASTTPLYKVIVRQPDGGSLIYQLIAAGNTAAAAVGKTAEVSGTASTVRRGGRDVRILSVKTLKVVSERCGLTAEPRLSRQ